MILLRMRKAFTMIELLVVVAIIGILGVVVVLTLNPVQLMAQSRDANRVADLASLNAALSFYQSDQGNTSAFNLGNASSVYVSIPDATLTGNNTSTCASLGLPALPSGYTYYCVSPASLRDVDGTGWIPVNFNTITGGSPIATLPADRVNQTSTNLYYIYSSSGNQFEVTAIPESQKEQAALEASPPIQGYPGVMESGSSPSLSPLYDPDYLLGYWNLDDGQGMTAKDLSGYNHNGTLTGTTTPAWSSSSNCKVGTNCLVFTNGYVSAPSAGTTTFHGGYTVAAWVNSTNISADQIFMSFGLPYVRINSKKIVFATYVNGIQTNLTSPTILSQGTWYFVACSYDGSTMKIYINGLLDTQNATSGTMTMSTSLYLGNHSSGSFFLQGSLDDARFYNYPLSAAQVLALYNAMH